MTAEARQLHYSNDGRGNAKEMIEWINNNNPEADAHIAYDDKGLMFIVKIQGLGSAMLFDGDWLIRDGSDLYYAALTFKVA